MTEHLPECDHLASRVTHWTCICQELSAREQRVREGWYEVQSETWEQGFYHALDAAREAVLSYASKRQELCRPATPCEDITAALRVAATRIDELRGEQDPTRKE